MNLLLLEHGQASPGERITLGERYATHAQSVWRSRPGDRIRVGVEAGLLGIARIVGVSSTCLEIEIESLNDPPPPPLGVSLALALPRPPALRRCLEQAAMLGVKRIDLFPSARVEKSFWRSRELHPERIRERLWTGLEQGVDTVLPTVKCYPRFRVFAEERINAEAAVADPSGTSLASADLAQIKLLVIGPEGGFLPREIDELRERGAGMWSLGSRILRVDTACVVAIGMIGGLGGHASFQGPVTC